MYTVYVLLSTSTGKQYTGQTENLQRRLLEHELGLAHFSRGRGPWKIVLTEEYDTRAEAMQREKFLKSGRGRAFIKQYIDHQSGSASGGLPAEPVFIEDTG